MAVEKKKLSELTVATTLDGLEALGVETVSGTNRSVRVPMSLLRGNKGEDGKTPTFQKTGEASVSTSPTAEVILKGSDPQGNPIYSISLGIPKGEKGETGKTPAFISGTITSVPAGTAPSAEVVLDGENPEGNPRYKINMSIPQGEEGEKGEIGDTPEIITGAIATGEPGSAVTAEFVLDPENPGRYIVNMSVPQGQPGTGSGNVEVDPQGLDASKTYLVKPKQNDSAQVDFQEFDPDGKLDTKPDGVLPLISEADGKINEEYLRPSTSAPVVIDDSLFNYPENIPGLEGMVPGEMRPVWVDSDAEGNPFQTLENASGFITLGRISGNFKYYSYVLFMDGSEEYNTVITPTIIQVIFENGVETHTDTLRLLTDKYRGFNDGNSSGSTVASIPTYNRSVLINQNVSATLALSGSLSNGQELMVKVYNTNASAAITITFPTSNTTWDCKDRNGVQLSPITIPVGGSAEISIWRLNSKYVVKTDWHA